jgi:hypothetical protein
LPAVGAAPLTWPGELGAAIHRCGGEYNNLLISHDGANARRHNDLVFDLLVAILCNYCTLHLTV